MFRRGHVEQHGGIYGGNDESATRDDNRRRGAPVTTTASAGSDRSHARLPGGCQQRLRTKRSKASGATAHDVCAGEAEASV